MLELGRRFPRKRALITGAASGLGRSLALQLAAEGWTLWLTDVRADALPTVEGEVRAAGGTPHLLGLDVTDRAQWTAAVAAVTQKTGGLDVLVNNAGVGAGGLVGEFEPADWDWVMGINFMGVVNGCHAFVPMFRAQQAGHVINVASAAALIPVPRMAAYCSAKAAVKMFSEVLSHEMADVGVGVTVVMPEFFRTNLGDRTRGPETERARKMINKSRYTAEQVSDAALKAAGARQLHMVFPAWTRVAWWLWRVAPETVMPLIRAVEKKTRKPRQPAGAAPAA
jgi:NAD(P)-dependent dehydrogenase (short-subunit alcohol dehydrogenase family)